MEAGEGMNKAFFWPLGSLQSHWKHKQAIRLYWLVDGSQIMSHVKLTKKAKVFFVAGIYSSGF